MRSCGLVVLAACSGDVRLAVSVHHPPSYAVTQTRVTVYFGDDISCSQVEFGDRTEAELAAITVDEVDVTDGAHLTDISRLGGKSIAARGFDAQHRFVTAGCKDIGEIAGTTEVAIDTQPTSVVAIDPSQPDRPFAERMILVNMTDPRGTALDGNVSWQLTGPAGAAEQPPAIGVATSNGDATIRVDDLGTPGPQGLRIRVPWAIAPLPLVTGFDLSHATPIPLGGGNIASHPSCDIRGHAGRPPTLICLTQANAQLHRDAVEIAWRADRYVATPIPIPASIDNQYALFVDHDGSADEPVYVISANAAGVGHWHRLGTASGTPIVFDGGLQNLVYIPKCRDNSVTALAAIQTGTALLPSKQFFTPTGVATRAADAGEVFSGGCVSDVDKHEHQAVVGSGATGDAVLVLIVGADQMQVPGVKLNGSGFIAVETQGVIEKRFAGTRLQATGTVVFEAVLAPDPGGFKLVERTEVEAAAPPTKILGGKLDKDGDTDLMWDLPAVLRRRVFQVSLAKRVNGAPLTAMTSGPTGPTVAAAASDFIVGDLNGHLTDEMVLFTQSAVTIYSPD